MKRDSQSYQRNRAPSEKFLSQTPCLRFRDRATLVIESFFTKIGDHNYVL